LPTVSQMLINVPASILSRSGFTRRGKIKRDHGAWEIEESTRPLMAAIYRLKRNPSLPTIIKRKPDRFHHAAMKIIKN
jgi:hypothetical protein